MSEQQEKVRPKVGVAVLVSKGDRILLTRRKRSHGVGTWAPPGGNLDFGETLEQCAARETKEETGVEITDIKFRVITNDVFAEEQKHYITVWLEAKYVSGEARVNAPDEASEVDWFTWDALPEPLFLPLQHLLSGETYPSQTTEYKVGASPQEPRPLQY